MQFAPHLPSRLPRVKPEPTVNATTPIPDGVLITSSFDGACYPNPGPMGVGYIMKLNEKNGEEPRVVVRVGGQVGKGTNNEAEYHALLALMRHALRLGFWNLTVTSDSLLVVKQMEGEWKAKGKLARLRDEAQNLRRLFNTFALVYLPREYNAEADALSHEMVFEEPELPPIPKTTGRIQKALHEWQAAAIRIWWHRHHPGAGTLSRIFGLATTAIEQIAKGESYRTADFSGYDEWIDRVSGETFRKLLEEQ